MPYQRSERFIGPQLWAQAFSEMGQNMADAIKQHGELKKEAQGLDFMGDLLKKHYPDMANEFKDEWVKWPGMSNTQKKALIGGMGAFMGNKAKARETQLQQQEDALRMAGMAQDQQRKLEEDAALRRFGGAMNERMNPPNAVGSFIGGMQEVPIGQGMDSIQQFADRNPAARIPVPVSGSDVANIGVQAGVMDPKLLQGFADLNRQDYTPGTVEDVPGAPWLKFLRKGRTGGGDFSKVPEDPQKFAGQPSQSRRIRGMPGFWEVTKPDGSRQIVREPVVNPLDAALAANLAGSQPGAKPNPAKDASILPEEIANIKDPKARAAAEFAFHRWMADRLSDEEYQARLLEYTE
jgi:hypothetical protein